MPILIVISKAASPLLINIETWSFDRVFNKENLYGKCMQAGIYPSSFANVRLSTKIDFLNVVKCK